MDSGLLKFLGVEDKYLMMAVRDHLDRFFATDDCFVVNGVAEDGYTILDVDTEVVEGVIELRLIVKHKDINSFGTNCSAFLLKAHGWALTEPSLLGFGHFDGERVRSQQFNYYPGNGYWSSTRWVDDANHRMQEVA